MSIIYDALKKAQNSINRPGVEAGTQGKYNKPKQYLLYVLVVCVGLFLGNTMFAFFTHPKKIPAKQVLPLPLVPEPVVTSSKALPVETAVIPAKLPENKPQEEFVLNGIFFSQNEVYALINNQIVKEGDEIAGAIVKRIEQDTVELENAGVVVKLSTQ